MEVENNLWACDKLFRKFSKTNSLVFMLVDKSIQTGSN